jgi:hypothetical protein
MHTLIAAAVAAQLLAQPASLRLRNKKGGPPVKTAPAPNRGHRAFVRPTSPRE